MHPIIIAYSLLRISLTNSINELISIIPIPAAKKAVNKDVFGSSEFFTSDRYSTCKKIYDNAIIDIHNIIPTNPNLHYSASQQLFDSSVKQPELLLPLLHPIVRSPFGDIMIPINNPARNIINPVKKYSLVLNSKFSILDTILFIRFLLHHLG